MNIPAGKFKAKCLKIMDDLARTREEVIVTKHGKPVAMLVPVRNESLPSIFGFLKGSVSYSGDLREPIGEKWEADE